jgi:hypothetical protein
MLRTRIGWLAAIAALGLAAGACKKNDAAKGNSGTTADKSTTGTSSDKSATAVAVASGDDLALLPVDSEMVMGLNFAQLQQSALWKQFSPKLMDKAAPQLADFKAACGFDPLEAIKGISVGMKNIGGTTQEGAIVVHGPEKAKVMACLDKAKAEAAKKGSEVTIDGDVFTVKDKAGQNFAFTFVNDSTLLGVIGPAASKDSVLAAAKGTSALKSSPAFVEMFSKVNTHDSLWMLMNGNSPAFKSMSSFGVKPKAVFGSLNVTDGLTVDLRVRMEKPEDANSFVMLINSQISQPQVKAMFDKLGVLAEGVDARFSLAMSNQKLQQLMAQFGGMMGMMGGAGGP